MKFVYVLTSSERDLYYEQFLLSLASFRIFNPDLNIVLLIDEKTKKNLVNKRTAYEKYVTDTIVVKIPDEFSQKEASRFLKTTIHHHISENFLFLDCDTIISDDLMENFPANVEIGAVLDTHVTLDKHHLKRNFQEEDKKVGFVSSFETNFRFNGGLIYYKKSINAENLFEKWHSLWVDSRNRGCSQDMPALNQANFELGNIISELGGEWNCQICHNGLSFLSNSKMIHYFATSLITQDSPYLLASDEILSVIKDTGLISDEINIMLKQPKSAFSLHSRIVSGNEILDVLNSNLFSKLLWIRKNKPAFFTRLNTFTSKIKNKKKKQS